MPELYLRRLIDCTDVHFDRHSALCTLGYEFGLVINFPGCLDALMFEVVTFTFWLMINNLSSVCLFVCIFL